MSIDRMTLEEALKFSKTATFYQLLEIGHLATAQEIRDAFHREALTFHPDRYYSKDPKQRQMAKEIYTKIVEAYRSLINREKRLAYDSKLTNPVGAGNTKEMKALQSLPGFKFFKMAQSAVTNRNWNSAKMNIQIALSESPDDPDFKALEQKILGELKKPTAK